MRKKEIHLGGFYALKSGIVREVCGLYLGADGQTMVHWRDRFGPGHCAVGTFAGRVVQRAERPADWFEGRDRTVFSIEAGTTAAALLATYLAA